VISRIKVKSGLGINCKHLFYKLSYVQRCVNIHIIFYCYLIENLKSSQLLFIFFNICYILYVRDYSRQPIGVLKVSITNHCRESKYPCLLSCHALYNRHHKLRDNSIIVIIRNRVPIFFNESLLSDLYGFLKLRSSIDNVYKIFLFEFIYHK